MPAHPNILFIIADDHRYGALGATGDPAVQTPVLDRLVAQGTSFDRTYHLGGLSGAVCVPTRACLLTGSQPFRASATQDMSLPRLLMTINPELAVLPAVFRRAGYHTFAAGKWHNDRQSFAQSFSAGARLFFGGMSDHRRVPLHDFDPSGEYPPQARYEGDGFSTELFAGAAIDFLRQHQGPDPFFLYLAFTAPHDPRTPPPEYARLYRADDIPLPPNFLPEHPFDNGELQVRDEALAPWPRTPEVVRQHLADYYGMISHLDAWIGRILAALEESGRAGETIVVYTADHGLAVGQHGLLGKQNLYEHSVRVPCILRGPGIPAGRRCDAMTITPDLFPTLCDLAGVAVPDTVESRSLVPLLTGSQTHVRDSVVSVYKDGQRMVCDGRWKLIRYARAAGGRGGSDRQQLFDLLADPWECHDLAGEPGHADRLRQLAGLLAAWQERAGDPCWRLSGAPDGGAPGD